MFVKPSDDPSRAVVRDPVTQQIVPSEGMDVPDHDAYWVRLLRDGDVVLAERPDAVDAETAQSAAEAGEEPSGRRSRRNDVPAIAAPEPAEPAEHS